MHKLVGKLPFAQFKYFVCPDKILPSMCSFGPSLERSINSFRRFVTVNVRNFLVVALSRLVSLKVRYEQIHWR